MSDESVKHLATSDNTLVPSLHYIGVRPIMKLNNQYLKQDKVTFSQKKVANCLWDKFIGIYTECWIYVRKFFIWS